MTRHARPASRQHRRNIYGARQDSAKAARGVRVPVPGTVPNEERESTRCIWCLADAREPDWDPFCSLQCLLEAQQS